MNPMNEETSSFLFGLLDIGEQVGIDSTRLYVVCNRIFSSIQQEKYPYLADKTLTKSIIHLINNYIHRHNNRPNFNVILEVLRRISERGLEKVILPEEGDLYDN